MKLQALSWNMQQCTCFCFFDHVFACIRPEWRRSKQPPSVWRADMIRTHASIHKHCETEHRYNSKQIVFSDAVPKSVYPSTSTIYSIPICPPVHQPINLSIQRLVRMIEYFNVPIGMPEMSTQQWASSKDSKLMELSNSQSLWYSRLGPPVGVAAPDTFSLGCALAAILRDPLLSGADACFSWELPSISQDH